MKALRAMLDRITQPRDNSRWDYMALNENLYDEPIPEKLFWEPYIFIFKKMPEAIGVITVGFI